MMVSSHDYAATSIDASLGAGLVGVLVTCVMLGIVITQTHTYFQTFGDDPTWLKTIVGFVFFLEVGQSACISHLLYYFAVTGYGKPIALIYPPSTFGTDILLTLMLKFIFEIYFIYRILKLTSSKILVGIAVLLNAIAIIVGLAVAVYSLIENSLVKFNDTFSSVILTSFATSLVIDTYISVVLVTWLLGRRRVALRPTAKILDRILLWSLQTGSITSLNSVVLLITYKLMPTTYIYIAFYNIQSKLYSNSLLASLNARALKQDSNIELETLAGSYLSRDDQLGAQSGLTNSSPLAGDSGCSA